MVAKFLLEAFSNVCDALQDTVHSAMSVVTRLCGKIEPTDSSLLECSANLGALLEHEDPKV